MIIDGWASISAIAFFSVRPALSASGSLRKVVPARLSSASQPTWPPSLERGCVDAGRLVVVEGVGDAVLVEPGPGLLHRVAVLDAVDRDGLGCRHRKLSVMAGWL